MRAEPALTGTIAVEAGGLLLRGEAASLVSRWRTVLTETLGPLADTVVDPPAFLDPRVLRLSGYERAFPQHVVLARGRSGRTIPLAPAACLHVYPLFEGVRVPGHGSGILVEARCARFEGGRWRPPYRLLGFRMLELVLVGDAPWVRRRLERAETAVDDVLARLGVPATWRPATDPFFSDGSRVMQRLTEAKRELSFDRAPGVAVASVNRHGDHFTRAFHISAGATPAASACLAFGLERLGAASLAAWGPRRGAWPKELRP